MADQHITHSLQQYYDKVFQDGHLVSVSISKWGMCVQLGKDDIEKGFNEGERLEGQIPTIFKLGQKYLIKPERIKDLVSTEGKARRVLYKNSYNFPIGEAHFVPKAKLVTVLSELEKHREAFNKAKAVFVANYETYKKEVLDAFPQFRDSLLPCYPPINKIASFFDFSINTYRISMPKEFEGVDLQKVISEERVEKEAKQEASKKIAGQLDSYYEQSKRQIDAFVEQVILALRSQIGDVCGALQYKIEKGLVISKQNIDIIKKEIDNFRSMNFLDDSEVEKVIADLEKLINGKNDYKKDKEIVGQLNQTLTKVLEATKGMSDLSVIKDRYFRAIRV